MSFYGVSDISAMLAEFGVDVSVDAHTGKGLLDLPGVEAVDSEVGGVSDIAGVLVVQTGVFPVDEPGVEIVVGGIIYRVRDSQPIEDGALTRVQLSFI